MTDQEMLRKLGAGTPISDLCESVDWDRATFDEWWRKVTASCVTPVSGRADVAGLSSAVRIGRDDRGRPQIVADNTDDLFFGFGYTIAQDRLFQLDYLRRQGLGRLAEILGPDGVESDRLARTVGLNRIAAKHTTHLPDETNHTLTAFSNGINAFIEACGDRLPIEFQLLDYRPEPWEPLASVAIEVEFAWYLTGRFPVIFVPELARQAVGDGPLWSDFCLGEADDEAILPRDAYEPRDVPTGTRVGSDVDPVGSNNWVVGGSRTTSGLPLVASDPHIAFEAVSCWYPVHLCTDGYNVAGMTYVGMPGVIAGRNQNTAWSITNNICSQRDLYLERTDPAQPECFEFDGNWERSTTVTETIQVAGEEDVVCKVQSSRHGPVVDALLPEPALRRGTVSLRWLGAEHGGWLTSLLRLHTASSTHELMQGLEPWHVPTFSMCLADDKGNIGYRASGRIPVRNAENRGFRNGWDPADEWQGLLAFEDTPHVINPAQDWVATANNRTAPADYPHDLYGRWGSGFRGQRLRTHIEAHPKMNVADCQSLHFDTVSLRGLANRDAICDLLTTTSDPRLIEVARILAAWDGEVRPEAVAPSIFNTFVAFWGEAVCGERFSADEVALVSRPSESMALRLLTSDPHRWFANGDREAKAIAAMNSTIEDLTERFGSDMSQWTWSQIHRMSLKHVLSARGDLGKLLNHGGCAVPGDMSTVCNTGLGPNMEAATGAGYRMIADLSSNPPALLQLDAQGQSGQVGSPHYDDQLDDWLSGSYGTVELTKDAAARCPAQWELVPVAK